MRIPVSIGALMLACTALAQEYPARPIRLIVAFPPGGPTDAVARLVAQKISDRVGQQMVVDNRGGGSGIPGTEAAAKAAPDGYTLYFGPTTTLGILPSLHPTLPYDPRKSFAPVSLIAKGTLAVGVHPSVPAQTLQEFIALARKQPGTLNYGSAGSGTPPHLAAEMFMTLTNTKLVHIPYKGSGPAMTDLLGGRLHVMFDALPPFLSHAREGKLRVLAITSSERVASLPEVPTVAEAGLPEFEVGLWNGILAPAGTPRSVITRLNAEIRAVLAEATTKDTLLRFGLVPVWTTPEAFAAFIDSEIERWGKVVKSSGAKLE
jgi:tripartite-type tricarboxylate transporter receptor subunit TctC